jgi:acetoin utilization protein AcuC
MLETPRFIGSEIYRRSRYGSGHPLAIPRVSTVIDLSRALGWLPDGQYLDSPVASPEELARFHDRDYIAALVEAETSQTVGRGRRQRYNIGCNGNPVFPEIFRRPATACGGSLLGAALIRDGGTVYNPAGGTHHGRPDRASGFCYFNDPVLAILRLLDEGVRRVFYLDVDAHHGDGVQAAFAEDPRVLTVSLHEAGRWPMTTADGVTANGTTADGAAGDTATGDKAGEGTVHDRAGGTARNLPVPPGFHDDEMAFLLDRAVLPLAEAFAPDAVVQQGGADALDDDPQSKLALSNRAIWGVVAAMRSLAPRLLVLGGGGYNPWSVARCWAGVWGLLNGHIQPGQPPERLPPPAEAVLRDLRWRHSKGRNPPDHWFTSLADPPHAGPVRPEVRRLAAQVLQD